MQIDRILTTQIKTAVTPGKVVVVYGPRRVGKTTVIKELFSHYGDTARLVNGDTLPVRRALSSQDVQELRAFIGSTKILFVDEAQRIENIGINLKIIVDTFPDVALVVTGSATLELASTINEPLTGRTKTFFLYPVSYTELYTWLGPFESKQQLSRLMIYGSYPEALVLESDNERKEYLIDLVSKYLYRDVLDFAGIKKAKKIVDLLRLIAFQIGNEVSIAELSSNLDLDRVTVEKYLDLLEQSFVIYYVGGLSRNLRKEVVKNGRYYFYDNGVRNALIENFNDISIRNDIGSLWENFCAIERRKYTAYRRKGAHYYFWRTYDQKEIDIIEEGDGVVTGYECKWSKGVVKRTTRNEFEKAYQKEHATVQVITRDNFEPFVGVE